MRLSVLLLVAALTASHAQRAHACSINPPYLTIEALAPANGTVGFPRDGAITLRLKEWASDGRGMSVLEVRVVTQTSGAAVSGDLDRTFRFEGDWITWRPRTPLQANTQYRVDVMITSTTLPTSVTGPASATAIFTTSDQLSPPLQLDGSLRAQVRPGTAPRLKCGPCGNCTKIGERPALLADVAAPRIEGGYDAHGYAAWLSITDRTGPVFDGAGDGRLEGEHSVVLSQFLNIQPRAIHALTLEIPRPDPITDICLGWNVWDAAGHAKSAQALCLSAEQLEAAFAQLDMSAAGAPAPVPPAADAGLAVSPPPDPVQPDAGPDVGPGPSAAAATGAAIAPSADPAPVAPAEHASACSAAMSGRSTWRVGWLSYAGMLALWLRRRRRHSLRA